PHTGQMRRVRPRPQVVQLPPQPPGQLPRLRVAHIPPEPQLPRVVPGPDPPRRPEIRDPRLGRHPGPREHHNPPRPGQQRPSPLESVVRGPAHHIHEARVTDPHRSARQPPPKRAPTPPPKRPPPPPQARAGPLPEGAPAPPPPVWGPHPGG